MKHVWGGCAYGDAVEDCVSFHHIHMILAHHVITGIPSSSKGHAALASSPQQGNKEKGNKGARGSVKGRKTAGKGGRNEKQAGESKKQASKTGLRGKKGEGKRKDKGTKEAQRKKRKH